MSKQINVALIGNPNTGKTSVFNALTGLNQKVGNFPGVKSLAGASVQAAFAHGTGSGSVAEASGRAPTVRWSESLAEAATRAPLASRGSGPTVYEAESLAEAAT